MATGEHQNGFSIRQATPASVKDLHTLMLGLANYEKKDLPVSKERISELLFNSKIEAGALIAYFNGQPVGYSMFYYTFLSFPGEIGMFLEDLYVKEEHQGKKFGFKLFKATTAIAHENKCKRLSS